ncbi:MAG TPA: uroporphyrinogen-III synthase [Steroidobacteraceae bacterium]|nr:uroporphyrinogen-III synthase [Steroidobacteraceae bacterium]
MEAQPLSGRTVAVPETRELEVFAALLERRGARVLRCPLVAIRDAPDPQPTLSFARRFAAADFDDLILLTGEGLRRILATLEAHEPALREAFVVQLGRVRRITRGPKPARALRELGLRSDLPAAEPTTAGVIAALSREDLAGRRVAVQLYGTEPNEPLVSFLKEAGAHVSTVAPYVYASAADDEAVRGLLAQLAAGAVDAIAFTSSPQVERLYAVADAGAVSAALSRTLVAAVGPVVAERLKSHGVAARLMPQEAFFLKPLTQALEDALGTRA